MPTLKIIGRLNEIEPAAWDAIVGSESPFLEWGWLSALEDALRKAPVSICGGKTVNHLSQNAYSAASQMLLDFLYLHYSPQDHVGGFFPTYNLALPKANFLEMGGFDAGLRFGEDRAGASPVDFPTSRSKPERAGSSIA